MKNSGGLVSEWKLFDYILEDNGEVDRENIIRLLQNGASLLDVIEDYVGWNMKDVMREKAQGCRHTKDHMGFCVCDSIKEGNEQVLKFVELLRETNSDYWKQVLTKSKKMQKRKELK